MSEQAAAAPTSAPAEPTAAPTSVEPSAPETGEATEPIGAPESTEAQTPAAKWKLKIDGQEEELAQDEVIKWAQQGRASQRRFDEAAKLRQQAEQERQTLTQQIDNIRTNAKRDPLGFLGQLLGGDRDAVYDYIYQAMQYEALPLEEKRRIEQDHHIRQRAAKADEYEKRERDQAAAAETAKLEQQFASEAHASLTAVGLDADDPDVMERWLMQRISAGHNGVEMTAEEAAQRVAGRVTGFRKKSVEQLAKLKGEELLQALPAAVLTEIRSADAARLTAKQQRQRTPTGKFAPQNGASPARPQKRNDVSPEKWLRTVRTQGIDAANKLLDE